MQSFERARQYFNRHRYAFTKKLIIGDNLTIIIIEKRTDFNEALRDVTNNPSTMCFISATEAKNAGYLEELPRLLQKNS